VIKVRFNVIIGIGTWREGGRCTHPCKLKYSDRTVSYSNKVHRVVKEAVYGREFIRQIMIAYINPYSVKTFFGLQHNTFSPSPPNAQQKKNNLLCP